MKTLFRILIVLLLLYPSNVLSAGDASKYLDEAESNLREVAISLKEFQNAKNQTILADAAKSNNKAYEKARGYTKFS